MIDYHPSASKRGGAWCSAMRAQRLEEKGKFVTPLVSMVTNFTPPQVTLRHCSRLTKQAPFSMNSAMPCTTFCQTLNIQADFPRLRGAALTDNGALGF